MIDRDSGPAKALQNRFRARRFAFVLGMIRDLLAERETITILDAGGLPTYWELLPPEFRDRVEITCLNYGAQLEMHAQAPQGLRVASIPGDACAMPQYADGQFDLVHSNSVIEHVGSYQKMMNFAGEIRRVGRAYYVQTPNFWFPVDPHYAVPFMHWLPDPVRAWIFTHLSVGFAPKLDYPEALRYLDDYRIVSRTLMNNLFPDGEPRSERFLLLWVKSLIVSRAAARGK